MENDGNDRPKPMFPIILKASGHQQYVPWTFHDTIGRADRLPVLTDGINKCITALEESTAGATLALRGIKALVMHIARKHSTEEILMNVFWVQLRTVVEGNAADSVCFIPYCNNVWMGLRKQHQQ